MREENQTTRRKILEARQEPTINSTHIWHWARIKPWPHWLEASALTTAPSLLPIFTRANLNTRMVKGINRVVLSCLVFEHLYKPYGSRKYTHAAITYLEISDWLFFSPSTVKGDAPVRSSYMSTPKLHQSTTYNYKKKLNLKQSPWLYDTFDRLLPP